MKRAVALLLLTASIVALPAHAQLFRRAPSDDALRQTQPMQGGMQMPSREEMEQLQRDAAEMQRLHAEMERLRNLGRYDEAQALARRLDELMSAGPMSRMLGGMGDALRGLPPGALPQGISAEDVEQAATSFSASGAIGMERRMMEGEELYLPEPLFVKALVLHYSSEMMRQSAKVPVKAREILMDGYGRMQAKDYDGAEAAFRQAAALTRSPEVLQAQARLHMARGNPKTALRLLETFQQRSPSLLWLQAEIHSSLGEHKAAVQAAERALAATTAHKGDGTDADAAVALNNLGVVLQQAGEPKAALERYQKSVEALQAAAQGAGQQDAALFRVQVPTVASNLGLALWQQGDSARAAEAFRVALDERAWFESANEAFMTERAQLARAQAVAVELHALISLDPNLGLQTLLERKGALLERRARAQTAFRRDAQAEPQQPGALGRMFEGPVTRMERERSNRQIADDRDLMREYDAVVQERAALAGKGARTPADQARIASLDTQIQVLQQRMQMRDQQSRTLADGGNLSQSELRDIARKSGNNPQALTDAVQKRMDEFTRGREQAAKDARASLLPRVQVRVPPGAVLLEMVKYRPTDPRTPGATRAERYGTYLIKPGSEPEYLDLGEAAPLEKLVADFRAALSTPDRPVRDLARRLDEALMRPVRAKLAGATTLHIAPEGSLNLVPFAALMDEQGAYLVERYTLNYLASGRDLLVLARNEPARSPALIIADPAFDQTSAVSPAQAGVQTRSRDFRSTKYNRLPATALEAQTLKKVLPDAAVLTGTAATETATKQIAGPRILHIATHGFFLQDLPGESEDPMLRSGLVFAGVNSLVSGSDDGVLTALEASNLDLRGTKLVVLSACETGVGEVRNGEGVFGLRRAFVVAGAETLLMSLWQVADEATKDLMTTYYLRLVKGETRADALRQAQLSLLKEAKTAHPFFWAAFISSGETSLLR